MGTCAYAHLAYGYDLGACEDLPEVPWLDEGDDFSERALERISAAGVTGVEFAYSGHYDYPGYVLCAEGSERSVAWAQTMPLEMAPRPEWDTNLTAAVAALGMAPTQDGPRWLVFPSYG